LLHDFLGSLLVGAMEEDWLFPSVARTHAAHHRDPLDGVYGQHKRANKRRV